MNEIEKQEARRDFWKKGFMLWFFFSTSCFVAPGNKIIHNIIFNVVLFFISMLISAIIVCEKSESEFCEIFDIKCEDYKIICMLVFLLLSGGIVLKEIL